MFQKEKKKEFPSELRYDLVSGDWVVIATGRSKRPETFRKERRQKEEISREKCPFCEISEKAEPTLIFSEGKRVSFEKGDKISKDWTTIVLPNKYPAFSPSSELNRRSEGKFFQRMNAVGFHEVVVTGDHKKQIAQLSENRIRELIDLYQQRYLDLKDKEFVNYISIFQNHGVEAGASIAHPHSQIITTPLIDSDLKRALRTAKEYFEDNKKCIYCEMNKWEKEKKERIIFQNDGFLALCPFASKAAFEIIISPKKHLSYFEKITDKQKKQLAETFQKAFGKLYKGLDDPPYNFYLHTSPCDGKEHNYYHWHFTILPKTATWAGFEIGTQMEISTIEPEKAAQYLRKQ